MEIISGLTAVTFTRLAKVVAEAAGDIDMAA
jgi:hypothetical protein